ncbi:cAMP-binding domain of CRP or a regulatory subunit of cAMP-dependent protein kinases [Chitinophaga sp. CF118]|uniref:Crp/Fnr family transcriptional regulator n=1 Tax=Chitinophaga sp. CF118 TaxID=1884367 RepID=UPI0008DFB12B|nr:Crp/Fnr family transcriptional regulator [Chitinophaga sp. CF118]SFE44077.1 cAMP-binding domain of CRP or a regulatory subunit of cAMP-dependent protein kinases [Chitinophaga sp. CF118]
MEKTFSLSLENKIRSIAAISQESLSMLVQEIQLMHISKNEMLLTEGQFCKHVYFVEKGGIRTFMHNNDMKEINVNFTFDNSFTTELKSLRTSTPSAFFMQALEDTTVWLFEKDVLLALYAQSHEISNFGRSLLEQLLMEQEEHANMFKLQTPAERYQYLYDHQPAMLQRISLTHLASYLGISRETLSRIRRH